MRVIWQQQSTAWLDWDTVLELCASDMHAASQRGLRFGESSFGTRERERRRGGGERKIWKEEAGRRRSLYCRIFWNAACATPPAQLSTNTGRHTNTKMALYLAKANKDTKNGQTRCALRPSTAPTIQSRCLQSYLIATILHAEYDPFLNNKICESKQTECSIRASPVAPSPHLLPCRSAWQQKHVDWYMVHAVRHKSTNILVLDCIVTGAERIACGQVSAPRAVAIVVAMCSALYAEWVWHGKCFIDGTCTIVHSGADTTYYTRVCITAIETTWFGCSAMA